MAERLSARLRRLRASAHLTQQQAARRAGVSVGALRDLEQGRTAAPRPASLAALAEVLGVELSELAGTPGKPLEINILGPLELRVDGAPVAAGGHKQAVMLGLLALHANEYVSREELAEYLWPERRPVGWAGVVHSYVARLRKRMSTDDGPAATIASSRQRYRLTVAPDCVDASVAVAASTLAAETPAAFERYDQTLRLWRGGVLEDLAELQHHPRVVALAQRRAQLVIAFADAALAARHAEHAIPTVDELAALEPLHEGVAARRIRLLAAAGRLGDAHAVFSTTRRLLVDELGVEPGAQLIDAYREVLDREAPIETGRTAMPQRGYAPAQLPGGLADFIGRADEVARLAGYLSAEPRTGHGPSVAAVTGTGGLGKTALAVHVAHEIRSRFPDGQLYVDLRGVGGQPAPAEQVLEQFLVSLGHARTALPERIDELAALYRSATSRGRFLIVLDNARDTDQVLPLLPGADGCAVIVTSRRFLTDLDGALHVRIATLAADESVALLRSVLGSGPVERHRADAERVATLCSGFPLALRLAASQAALNPAWGLDDLRQRLERTNGRLDLLRTSHRAVQACFELSYRDLPPDVARTFRLVSLSDGPDVGLDAAAALTGAAPGRVRAALDHLVEHSMLIARTDDRFAFHDLMRFYARRCADEQDSAAERHAATERVAGWYVATARRATATTIPHRVAPPADIGTDVPAFPSAQAAAAWLSAERANAIVTVGQAAAQGLPRHAWLLADAITGALRQRQQSHEWISTANVGLAAAERAGDPHGLVMMHECLARGYASRADQRTAIRHYREALRAATDLGWAEAEISVLENLGNAYQEIGDTTSARPAFVRALALSRSTGQRFWEAACLNDLGTNERRGRGDLGAAERYYRQALALNEQLPGGQPNVNLGNLGIVAHLRGNYEQAWQLMQSARALDEQAGNPTLLGETFVTLSETALALERSDDAAFYARQALALAQTLDDGQLFARALVASGLVQLATGSPLVATQQLERALDVARHGPAPAAELDALLALARHADAGGDLDREVAFASQARRLATRLGDRISEGKALHLLAEVAHHKGDRRDAATYATQARALFARSGHRPGRIAVDDLLASLERADDASAPA